MNLINKLDKYYAKSNKQTIKEHIDESLKILNILSNILELSDNQKSIITNMIIYHDIGKIVEDNQNLILQNSCDKPNVRHEILSALINENLTDVEIVSILTHHKSIKQIQDLLRIYLDVLNISLDNYNTLNLNKYIKEIEEKIGVKVTKDIDYLYDLLTDDDLLRNKENIFLKGVFMLCDHISSANIKIINNNPVFKDLYKFESYTNIQKQAINCNVEDIMVIAPTGIGKTETSLFYSDRIQNSTNSRRIFYILPYTASINAMYNRLKNIGIDVGMLHGKVEYFLYKEFKNKDKVKEEYSVFRKMIKPFTICTLFQICKAIFNCKYNEMIIAMLSNSIFIVDEIHCFNIQEFTMIIETLKFLKDNFNINICIMSASIPSSYIDIIRNRLNISKILYPSEEEYKIIKRHRVIVNNKTILDDIDKIKSDLANNKKVLICTNKVSTSQYLYKLLINFCIENNKKIRLIHGKFNIRDREVIEKDVVENNDIDLLIGTQVIEVSLNIDYDILYTEIAPIDALLQRFGRINRKRFDNILEIKNVNIYNEFDDSFIYDKMLIDKTKKLLYTIDIIEEDKVQQYIDIVYKDIFEIKKYQSEINQYSYIINKIEIGKWDKNFQDDMIGNIGGSVLPEILFEEYCNYIINYKYVLANSLLVNISKRQLNILLKKGDIIYNDKYNVFVIKKPYSSQIGLDL